MPLPKPATERPFTDRRRSVRLSASTPRRRSDDEAWFASSDSGDAPALETDWGSDGDSRLDSRLDSGLGAIGGEPDSGFLRRQAERLSRNAGGTTFERILRAFVAARLAIGLMLVFTQSVVGGFGLLPARMPPLVPLLCMLHASLALLAWLRLRLRHVVGGRWGRPVTQLSRLAWLGTVGVDIIVFTGLHALETGSSLNFSALLVFPVMMAGVLTPRPMALGTAAVATLAELSVAWSMALAGGDAMPLLTQAGLMGTGFFVIALLAGELAGRLAREEMSARGSLELARQQAQLNRLVIEEMQDGVLVVDRRGRVRAANPAARLLIAASGMVRPAPFQLQELPSWDVLRQAVERAFTESHWPEAGRDVTLDFGPGSSRTLRLRMRFTRRVDEAAAASEEFCVLFVEDVVTVRSRMRQEKLAAMGRVSAGIAHEIRNPLAAIAQANALLQEDAHDPAQRHLTQIVADNVERLKRLVEDVMEVAPGAAPEASVFDACVKVGAFTREWAGTVGLPLGADSALRLRLPATPMGVLFDPEHLRRVLVNLLDNARRHGSGRPGSILLELVARDEDEAMLSVVSDGAPITPDVERYLFEPFFSTRSRGTGLGLYICRELCERYGASIDFRLRPTSEGDRNEFFVVMRRALLETPQHPLNLAT